jgi:hypothetical protein
LLPKIKNSLDWHENFTTITRLQGKYNPTNFIEIEHWMKEIQASEVAAMKCTLVNQIKLVNFDWLSKNHYLLDWSENFTTQTRRKGTNFPTSIIEFKHWMQKLEHFELDYRLCEATFEPLGRWGVKAFYSTKCNRMWGFFLKVF